MEYKHPSISMDELYSLLGSYGVTKSQVLYILGTNFCGPESETVLIPIDDFFDKKGKNLDIWSIGGVYIRGNHWWVKLAAVYDHVKNLWTYMWGFQWIPDENVDAKMLVRCPSEWFLDGTASPYEQPETFN